MKKWFYGLFMAWGMFLSIPCPVLRWDEEARSEMLACMPFTGCIIGGLWALAAYLLGLISCPAALSAALLTALPWVLSGFIHLDGFMDVCDAVLSRRDPETKRRILKDSHCGSFAVISMALLALFGATLFASKPAGELPLLPLAAIPVTTRSMAGLAVTLVKPMETSQYSGCVRKKPICIASLGIWLAACIALPIVINGVRGLAPAAAALGYAAAAFAACRSLKGMNGDVSGFALTLGELMGSAVLVLVR